MAHSDAPQPQLQPPAMSELVLPDQFRCAYPFKFCNNHRTVRRDGKQHKLCDEHRDRANKHQKNLAARRQQIKERLQRGGPTSRTVSTQLSFADIADLLDDDTFLHVDCKEEDLKAVEALLSDIDSDE